MTCRLVLAACLFFPVSGLAASPEPETSTGQELISVSYDCEAGVEIPVVYVNPPEGNGYAVALVDGRLVGMRHVVSASGARYRSGEGAEDLELWGKGDQARFAVGPEDDSRTIHADCTASE